MKLTCLLPVALLTGCATAPTPVVTEPAPLPLGNERTNAVRTPEQLKSYPLGRYADPDDPELLHEGHTVYRAESSAGWNTVPQAPTEFFPAPGEMADPAKQQVALTAELEQRLKQEEQLLQVTSEQNEKLAAQVKALQEQLPTLRLSEPEVRPLPAPTPTPPPTAAPAPSPVPRTWGQWFQTWLAKSSSTPPPKGN